MGSWEVLVRAVFKQHPPDLCLLSS
jgi:hypothetical protein